MVGIFRLHGQHHQGCNEIFTIVLETDLGALIMAAGVTTHLN